MPRYRPHPDVVSEPAGRDLLLVHLAAGTTFRLNAAGRAIFEGLDGGRDAREIAVRLHEGLGVAEERLERDAAELLGELARCRLVEEVTS